MSRNSLFILFVAYSVMVAAQSSLSGETPDELLQSASEAANRRENEKAIKLATQAIEMKPDLAFAYYLRGRSHFCAGNVHASVVDLDKYVELNPKVAPRQWERGISYYYDKQYKKGADQFILYQTYDDADVENSVWRFLCQAPIDGVEKARKDMLPIENDRRIPMMDVYNMFRGRVTPDEVLEVAKENSVNNEALNRSLFYAHLYIGLYHEAHKNPDLARKHITLAADKHKIGHYMWDVAHIHAKLLAMKNGKASDKGDSTSP